ncbi:MAG TPA: hypothetical protein VF331_03110 [Polyangiales bacterium]
MQVTVRSLPWLLPFFVGGCAGSSAQSKQPSPAHAPAQTTANASAATRPVASPAAPATEAAALADAGLGVTAAAVPALPALPVQPALAPEINAGAIPRAALKAVLAEGIGRFLRSVRAEPDLIKGHFAGWRITSLFADAPGVHVAVLRAGDTVRRANGQSIERPEEFQSVWDSLATANELVLDIERAGKPSKLRYTIAD